MQARWVNIRANDVVPEWRHAILLRLPVFAPTSAIEGIRFPLIRDCGNFLAHTVSLPPNARKPYGRREEAMFVLVVAGVFHTDISGHEPADCEPLSLTYHPPGEEGGGMVGAHGAQPFTVLVREGEERLSSEWCE